MFLLEVPPTLPTPHPPLLKKKASIIKFSPKKTWQGISLITTQLMLSCIRLCYVDAVSHKGKSPEESEERVRNQVDEK